MLLNAKLRDRVCSSGLSNPLIGIAKGGKQLSVSF